MASWPLNCDKNTVDDPYPISNCLPTPPHTSHASEVIIAPYHLPNRTDLLTMTPKALTSIGVVEPGMGFRKQASKEPANPPVNSSNCGKSTGIGITIKSTNANF